jgi:hypothetical protein
LWEEDVNVPNGWSLTDVVDNAAMNTSEREAEMKKRNKKSALGG